MNVTANPEFQLQPIQAPRWVALYTKGRHEKFIDLELKKRRFESFLPLRRIKRRWSDRTVIVEEPLFSSYVFVKTDLGRSPEVLRTKGAVKFVSTKSMVIPIEDTVINSLRKISGGDIFVDPFPYLSLGNKVYVRSGIFKGVEGFIVRKDDKRCRLVISVDAIMSSISIDVDAYLVERI